MGQYLVDIINQLESEVGVSKSLYTGLDCDLMCTDSKVSLRYCWGWPSRTHVVSPRHALPVLSLHSHLTPLPGRASSVAGYKLPSCLSYVSSWTVDTGVLVHHVCPLPIWDSVFWLY